MRGNPYELLDKLGQGGMGVVYRARHRETGAMVAVKMLTEQAASNPMLCARFQQEYAVASRISHPNVVQALAFGIEDRCPFMVMQLVEGLSLGQRINRLGPLEESEALAIALQVAEGLDAAHRLFLVHRDVKPDNILLTPNGHAMLTDLGLVKDLTLRKGLTSYGAGLGTVSYVAPEQFENALLANPSSDIYALAGSLYHALTGTVPFSGPTSVIILKKKIRNEFKPPATIIDTISPWVNDAICRALDCTMENRPQSCDEFLALLHHRTTSDYPPLPGPPTTTSSPHLDRRSAFRFPSSFPIACRSLATPSMPLFGQVQDVSLTGLQIRLGRTYDSDTLLVMDLPEDRSSTRSRWVRVRWSMQDEDGSWLLGCSFDRQISEEDLNAMLGNPSRTIAVRLSDHK